MKPKFLFVCIGNICRSTMAHYIAEKYFGDSFIFESAGVRPHGNSAYPQTVFTLNKLYNIDSKNHKPQDFYQKPLDEFDIIYVLDNEVYMTLKNKYPHYKIIDWTVEDPYYGDQDLFDSIANEIYEKVKTIS